MFSSKTLIVWLVTLCVAYSSSAPSTNKSLEKTLVKHYNFLNKTILFDHMSYNETHAVYGLCSGTDYEKNCKITLDRLDSDDKSLSCDITIKASDKATKIDEHVRIALLLKRDRALVLSKEGQKLKLTNVNFHGCSTNDVTLATDEYQFLFTVNVVAYEDSYDVFYVNSKLCQNRSCRITFDNDGINVVKDTVAWGMELEGELKCIGFMQSVARHSPINGFIIRGLSDVMEPDILFANDNGEKILTVGSAKDASAIAVSTIGNNIGTCLSTWINIPSPENLVYTLECKQFDFEGKLVKTELQVNTSSVVGDDKKIRYIARLNLPQGFLLFAILCPENYYGPCSGEESYFVYRFNEKGEKLKSIEINDFKCNQHGTMGLPRAFQNDAGQRCVFFSCRRQYPIYVPSDVVSIGLRCFTDEELH